MTHDHHLTVGSFLISATLFLIGLLYLRQWMRVVWLDPDGVKSWRVGSFLVGLLLVWLGYVHPCLFSITICSPCTWFNICCS